jgi:quercetin dioxygenase-like cupin family protein
MKEVRGIMKVIDTHKIPFQKGNYEGGNIKTIVDESTGAKNFSFRAFILKEGGYVPLHNHPGSEDFILVVSGALEIKNETDFHYVPAGSAILIMPGEFHSVRNVYPGPTEYFNVYSPPGSVYSGKK